MLLQVESNLFCFQLAGFDLGEIEHVIDDAEQQGAGFPDRLADVLLFLIEASFSQQVVHADDGVHGGAQFVAHHGQKIGLGAVRLFGGFLGMGEGLFQGLEAGHVAHDGDHAAIDHRIDASLKVSGFGVFPVILHRDLLLPHPFEGASTQPAYILLRRIPEIPANLD